MEDLSTQAQAMVCLREACDLGLKAEAMAVLQSSSESESSVNWSHVLDELRSLMEVHTSRPKRYQRA